MKFMFPKIREGVSIPRGTFIVWDGHHFRKGFWLIPALVILIFGKPVPDARADSTLSGEKQKPL